MPEVETPEGTVSVLDMTDESIAIATVSSDTNLVESLVAQVGSTVSSTNESSAETSS